MLPYSFIGMWSYTNPATLINQQIPMTDMPDWVFVRDITSAGNPAVFNWGKASTAINPLTSEWFSNMPMGSYLATGQPSSTGTGITLYASSGPTGGYTFINQANPPMFSSHPFTTITSSGAFLLTTASTFGINVGDTIRLINVPSALELSAGGLYQVTATNGSTTLTLGYAATAATAAGVNWSPVDGGAGKFQKVYPTAFYPNTLSVLAITQANPGKVYFARPNSFTPGQLVDFQIPTSYGMTPMTSNGRSFSNATANSGSGPFSNNPAGAWRVLSVTNSATESSITIDCDTTQFNPFIIPTSANFQLGASPAVCMPAGSGVVPLGGSATIPASPPGTNLADAFDNRAQYIMQIGTNACGVANADMVVMAFKADFPNNSITNA